MEITVLIPTFNRPSFLRTALESLSNQTIGTENFNVLVSENGTTDLSRSVCSSFGQLNITYVKQEHQLSGIDHFEWLFSQKNTGFVAILCDDDWWHESHLELAVNALKNRDAVAYFSDFIYFESDTSFKRNLYKCTELFHILKNDFKPYSLNRFNSNELHSISFAVTAFHFSAWIVKAEVLKKCANILQITHPTFSDRILIPEIANFGDVLFNPISTACIRLHSDNDSSKYQAAEWINAGIRGSMYVLEKAAARNFDIKESWNIIYRSQSLDNRNIMNSNLANVFRNLEDLQWYEGYKDLLTAHLKSSNDRKFTVRLGKLLRRKMGHYFKS